MAGVDGSVLSLLVGMMWTASLASCFNLEPREALYYSYPDASTQGREPYFGFSVALQHRGVDNTNW